MKSVNSVLIFTPKSYEKYAHSLQIGESSKAAYLLFAFGALQDDITRL